MRGLPFAVLLTARIALAGSVALVTDEIALKPPSKDEGGRSMVDVPLRADLRGADELTFELRHDGLDPYAGFHVYLKTPKGWYNAPIEPGCAGRWNAVSVRPGGMTVEDGTCGWGDIRGFRVSAWRVTRGQSAVRIRNLRAHFAEKPAVAVLRSEGVEIQTPGGSAYAYRTGAILDVLEDLNVPAVHVSDVDLSAASLADVKLLVFTSDRELPGNGISIVEDFVQRGGRLLFVNEPPVSFSGLAANQNVSARFGSPLDFGAESRFARAIAFAPVLRRLLPERAQDIDRGRDDAAVREKSRAAHLRIETAGAADEIRAVWISEVHFLKSSEADFDRLISGLRHYGFTDVLPMLRPGAAYYASELLPAAPEVKGGVDHLTRFGDICRKYGIRVHAWVFNYSLVGMPKELTDRMVRDCRVCVDVNGKARRTRMCPSHPENQRMESDVMLEIAKRGLDGIHFDMIRYESSDYCFCNGCRGRFERRIGGRLDDWPRCVAKDGRFRNEWLGFRRDNVTALVSNVSCRVRRECPGVKISVAVFPSLLTDGERLGQDWCEWGRRGYVDCLMPMEYLLAESVACAKGRLRGQMEACAPAKLVQGIGTDAWGCNRDKAMTLADLVRSGREVGVSGFSLFEYAVRTRSLLKETGWLWDCDVPAGK